MNTKKIKISDLQIGMKIKTKDEYGNIVFKTVSNKFTTIVPKKDQVRLEFENGTIINCSTNHPIMVLENGTLVQRYPEYLSTEDVVITDTGNTRLVHIDVGQENDENYIDITVDNLHTFFTAESSESEMVLTHNSQGGVRGASCTASFPGWHLEFERLIELKNNKGTEETRIRTMDYSIALNETLYKRLVTGGDITLFSPDEVPDLYESFYSNDIRKFEELYTKYENSNTVTKKSISADEFFTKIMNERFETGRIYIINADNMNSHTPFYEPIYQSNLCVSGDTTISVVDENGFIEDINIQDLPDKMKDGAVRVWSRNINSGISSFELITDFAKTSPKEKVMRITDEATGYSITCTPYHKVFTKNRGYVMAKDLLETDTLLLDKSV